MENIVDDERDGNEKKDPMQETHASPLWGGGGGREEGTSVNQPTTNKYLDAILELELI